MTALDILKRNMVYRDFLGHFSSRVAIPLVVFVVLFEHVHVETFILEACESEFPFFGAIQNCKQLELNRGRKQSERYKKLDELRVKFLRSDISHWVADLPFQELLSRLQSRNLTAVQVLSAFMGRAVNATFEFNCVTEFVPDAMKWALELDSLPEVKGPLHGVPFCVKDDHNIQGMDTTLGCSKNLFKPAKETATLVKIFRDLGAIPFCKTNVPQTLLSFGSDNPIFGTTLNPLNKKLSPAGSSSGSGCLVGAKAVPFATGTDAAGSGRLPAHFNGVSSIMPTHRRLSGDGIVNSLPKLIGINAVPALFASKPSTLATIFKALTDNNIQHENDPETVPISWRANIFENKRPLRFGYVRSIAFFPTMGDTPMVIEKTREKLEALGHTVVPFDLPDGYLFMKTVVDLVFADGGRYLASQIQDDKIATSFKTMYFGIKFPNWQKRLAGVLPFSGRLQLILRAGVDSEKSVGLQETVSSTKVLAKDILRKMKANNLDLLLTPVFPVPALRLDDPANLFLAVCYVVLWNLVDFPAGVLPMGMESGRNISAFDTAGDIFLGLAKTNLKHAIGMPIGVQVVGKPFNEELVLRALSELEDLNFGKL